MTSVTEIKSNLKVILGEMLENCEQRYDAGRDFFEDDYIFDMTQEMAAKVIPWVARAMARIEKTLMERVDEWVIETTAEICEEGIKVGIEGRQKLWKTYLFDDLEGLLEDAFEDAPDSDSDSE